MGGPGIIPGKMPVNLTGDSGAPERNIFLLYLTFVFSVSFPQMSPGICCIPWLAVETWAPRTYCCCSKFGGFGVGAEIFLYILTFRFYEIGSWGPWDRINLTSPLQETYPLGVGSIEDRRTAVPRHTSIRGAGPPPWEANFRASLDFLEF